MIPTYLKIIAAAIICGLLALFILDYSWTKRRNGELEGEIIVWQGKYETVLAAQKIAEEENFKLRRAAESMDTALIEWRDKYAAIQRQNTRNQQELRRLANENEEIHNIIFSAVPCDVWSLLFPTTASGNRTCD